ncbi:MCE family protein [Mycobacterium sp. ACS4331]|uniref:MCE family protein n=1 Tax=Mycobacterium sp. ACS4331 TaxID=1834121 RepID=UPI000A584013|nr:MCE family protein [Mycobacterium sp. ACS4331]
MRLRISGIVWRLSIFVLVCLLGMFGLVSIFAELRFQPERSYRAMFASVSGLEPGNFVRIAGVEVGKVESVRVQSDATVLVEFTADDSVVLTEATRAIVRYNDLIGGRYLELAEGPGKPVKLVSGATISLENTSPALDLDALIGGFRPLFRALDPEQVNALSGQLIRTFQGEGPTINSILAQTAALTSTLADRDRLIGEVVTNLSTVLGSLGEHSEEFAEAVESMSELVHGLAARNEDLGNSVAYGNEAAASVAALLVQARPSLQKVVRETERTAEIVVADHEYVDRLLATLPESYRVLGRQGLNGDFFSFYLCDLILKVNGKSGQPVYVKVAGQPTGRCTPR